MQRGLQYLGLSVCLSVCLLSHISPLKFLSVLKLLSRTQQATEVKIFVEFSLNCSVAEIQHSSVESHTIGHIPAESTHAHYSQYHVKRSFPSVELVMTPSKVCPHWHELVVPRILHFSAFIHIPGIHRPNYHYTFGTPTCTWKYSVQNKPGKLVALTQHPVYVALGQPTLPLYIPYRQAWVVVASE